VTLAHTTVNPCSAKCSSNVNANVDASLMHDGETGQIDQTQLPTVCGDECGPAKLMELAVNPYDLHRRANVVLKNPHGVHPDATLDQCRRLDQDVVRGNHIDLIVNQLGERLARVHVEGVVRRDEREKSRSVDENRQGRMESAK